MAGSKEKITAPRGALPTGESVKTSNFEKIASTLDTVVDRLTVYTVLVEITEKTCLEHDDSVAARHTNLIVESKRYLDARAILLNVAKTAKVSLNKNTPPTLDCNSVYHTVGPALEKNPTHNEGPRTAYEHTEAEETKVVKVVYLEVEASLYLERLVKASESLDPAGSILETTV